MIKFLVMDVDGTLTDGKLYLGKDGELFKAFNVKDGCGIKDILPQHHITPIILTARSSAIVEQRCRELNVTQIHQGCKNKEKKLREMASVFGISADSNGIYEGIAYIGDDIADYAAMKICEKKGCPLDSVNQIKEISDFLSTKNGGEGAVREFIEWLVMLQD